MWFIFVVLLSISEAYTGSWKSFEECPKSCKCWEEHFVDLSIYRLTQWYIQKKDSSYEPEPHANQVFYEDDITNHNPLHKIVACLLPTNQDIQEFISSIPSDTEVLTLLEETGAENTTLHFNYFQNLHNLIALEITGIKLVSQSELVTSKLTCIVDTPIKTLKYLIINNIHFGNHKHIEKKTVTNTEEEVFVMEGQDDILPYNIYLDKQKASNNPTFSGFDDLILLKISDCNLQNIYWEMFSNLKKLLHLILEENRLKFLPDFVFFGVPNLQSLSLAHNNLLNIQITDLAGLLELEYLDLSYNNFSQLSELSFPPFPRLKVADFRNNPITTIFPYTFDVMNTTDSIIVGGQDMNLELLPNSFLGLNKLVTLTLINVSAQILKSDFFNGLPQLKELIISGNIDEIEFDTFIELKTLEKLILNSCNLKTISVDTFFGLENLQILDLSNNNLQILSPGVFDQQTNLKELYLNNNNLTELPKGFFNKMQLIKLLRINNNPWHCSCMMTDWTPRVTNKIKQRVYTICDSRHDKGVGCYNTKAYKYEYDNRVGPKCATPLKFKNNGVYQVLRRNLRCHKIVKPINKYKYSKKITSNSLNIKKIEMTNIKTIKNVEKIPNTKNIKMKELPNNGYSKKIDEIPNNQYSKQDIPNNLNPLNIHPKAHYFATNMHANTLHEKYIDKLANKKKKQNLRVIGKLMKMKTEELNNLN